MLYSRAQLALMYLGICTLLPYNCLLNVQPYFKELLSLIRLLLSHVGVQSQSEAVLRSLASLRAFMLSAAFCRWFRCPVAACMGFCSLVSLYGDRMR